MRKSLIMSEHQTYLIDTESISLVATECAIGHQPWLSTGKFRQGRVAGRQVTALIGDGHHHHQYHRPVALHRYHQGPYDTIRHHDPYDTMRHQGVYDPSRQQGPYDTIQQQGSYDTTPATPDSLDSPRSPLNMSMLADNLQVALPSPPSIVPPPAPYGSHNNMFVSTVMSNGNYKYEYLNDKSAKYDKYHHADEKTTKYDKHQQLDDKGMKYEQINKCNYPSEGMKSLSDSLISSNETSRVDNTGEKVECKNLLNEDNSRQKVCVSVYAEPPSYSQYKAENMEEKGLKLDDREFKIEDMEQKLVDLEFRMEERQYRLEERDRGLEDMMQGPDFIVKETSLPVCHSPGRRDLSLSSMVYSPSSMEISPVSMETSPMSLEVSSTSPETDRKSPFTILGAMNDINKDAEMNMNLSNMSNVDSSSIHVDSNSLQMDNLSMELQRSFTPPVHPLLSSNENIKKELELEEKEIIENKVKVSPGGDRQRDTVSSETDKTDKSKEDSLVRTDSEADGQEDDQDLDRDENEMEYCDPCYCYGKCFLEVVASIFCVSLL